MPGRRPDAHVSRRSAWPIRLVSAGAGAAALACGLGLAGMTEAGAWGMAAALALLLPGTMALGAPRDGWRGRAVRLALWGTGLLFAGAFGLALALPATEGTGAALFLGLPLRAALVVYGAGALPMLVLPLLHAWAFDDDAFRVDRLREGGDPGGGTPEPPAAAIASADERR